ncbi:hypothetical protein [Vibrio alfacsensis]
MEKKHIAIIGKVTDCQPAAFLVLFGLSDYDGLFYIAWSGGS